jgi:hypothetical protein
MRALGGFCIALICAGGLFGQYRTGSGTMVHHPPAVPGNAQRGNPSVRWPYQGYGSPAGHHGRTTFAYPLVVGGGVYDYGAYGNAEPYGVPPQQPNVTIINPQEQPPVTASPVIINIGIPPAQPGTASAAPPPPGPQEPEPQAGVEAPVEPSHYLIALKDHTIYSALAYWVDGSTLHYFTSGNTHNQVSVTLVDRELTQRLNQGSGLQVNLPPAR